jgi:hypothetical protein
MIGKHRTLGKKILNPKLLYRVFAVLSLSLVFYAAIFANNFNKSKVANTQTGELTKIELKGIPFYVTEWQYDLYYFCLIVGFILMLIAILIKVFFKYENRK